MLRAIKTWLRAMRHPRQHYHEMVHRALDDCRPADCRDREDEDARLRDDTRERVRRISERYDQLRRTGDVR